MISQLHAKPPSRQGGAEMMAPHAEVQAAGDGVPVTCEGGEEVLVGLVIEMEPFWH
jgi:hypothetical protein